MSSRVRSGIRSVLGLAVVAALTFAALLFLRDTTWWQDLTAGDDAALDELPSDLTQVLPTAVVTRSNVVDEADLVGVLRYEDEVEFVHRIDPVETIVTQQIGTGRRVQTVSATIEEPGQRAITALPAPAQIISSGDVLYESDSTPVFAFAGRTAAWRTMNADTDGDDVAQLQANLLAGGWASESLRANGEWTDSTTAAVEAWQEATGQEVTGTVALGDVWFIPGSIRITAVSATEGVIVTDGTPLFSYTAESRAIEATVDDLPEGLLDADDLRTRLPDGTEVPAKLRSITGVDDGFRIVIDADLDGVSIADVDGIEVTTTWSVSELVDALTVPPEALRRLDSGAYIVEVLEGDVIRTVEVDVVGQAGRVVAISGVDEQARVLIP